MRCWEVSGPSAGDDKRMPTEPQPHLPERPPAARSSTNGGVSADAAAAGGQQASVGRSGESRAGWRSPALPLAADRRHGGSVARRAYRRERSRRSGRWRRCRHGGIHVIVEGLTRARASVIDAHRRRAAGHDRRRARAGRTDARSRRVRPPAAGADRARAVGRERPVAGTPRDGDGHRRSAAARLPAGEPARHQAPRRSSRFSKRTSCSKS